MATDRSRVAGLRAARAVSVLALLVIGVDHLYEYSVDHYSAIPTIGTLFLLNAVGAFVVAAAVAVPISRLIPGRRAKQLTAVLAVAGIGLAGASLIALFVSESTPLFGFMEIGFRTSIVITIVAEVAAIVGLLALGVLSWRYGEDLGPPHRDEGHRRADGAARAHDETRIRHGARVRAPEVRGAG
jgi:MFS family permease